MLTIKILALVAIVLGAACVALLFVVLSHLKRAGGGVDADTLQKTVNAALSDTLRHEVTDPLLRAERENAAANRAELQTELRGSRTETTASVQTSMERLGHTLRESQREQRESRQAEKPQERERGQGQALPWRRRQPETGTEPEPVRETDTSSYLFPPFRKQFYL